VRRRSILASKPVVALSGLRGVPEVEQREPGRLPDKLEELGLPVLERRGQELRPELRPLEGLAVLRGVVAHLD